MANEYIHPFVTSVHLESCPCMHVATNKPLLLCYICLISVFFFKLPLILVFSRNAPDLNCLSKTTILLHSCSMSMYTVSGSSMKSHVHCLGGINGLSYTRVTTSRADLL